MTGGPGESGYSGMETSGNDGREEGVIRSGKLWRHRVVPR